MRQDVQQLRAETHFSKQQAFHLEPEPSHLTKCDSPRVTLFQVIAKLNCSLRVINIHYYLNIVCSPLLSLERGKYKSPRVSWYLCIF